ncbi:hypothetical protein RhiirA1_409934 [Rhizophagus irregularis]|uniref:Uncharacterized protein n=2 Tax=Rhizophagus irregularis TaxID=588596 RepID=A0A2I1EP03_9GLOM|nr:hypothetical protein GLOIN_2v1595420 [Rhizophagus irregularis DAOM 181602=DAOM 197198]PKC73935.1 hypothetical protein RhiirA1_409934 [Rhizophagus irregularis]PKY23853.1 hypothetical protein RhiirB3_412382 [Rhizophagus irregularis]POG72459.1 hypothetical protein GLOIN_2v1595420 [Rhizophagus irregularis DAOM 181602=DAOM 197198]UZO17664.1 hypothetical protein OCT59_009009 [Rhizophagus irregularis]CAB4474997.1 unnamed protein product [Rhizophagus irregularis]|eukprot:XP_025179325.1 hypothetical protein GLOIN_2v1595420 [Rhizophagus irregularis DAOM 181602=DAOM 197198]
MKAYYFFVWLLSLAFPLSIYSYRITALMKADTTRMRRFNINNRMYYDSFGYKEAKTHYDVYYQKGQTDDIVTTFSIHNNYTGIENCVDEYYSDTATITISSILGKTFLVGEKHFSVEPFEVKYRNCQFIISTYKNFFGPDAKMYCLKDFVMEYVQANFNRDYFYIRPGWKYYDCGSPENLTNFSSCFFDPLY